MKNKEEKKCEFCRETKEDVTLVKNPYNDCHEIELCDQCYENAQDNITYY